MCFCVPIGFLSACYCFLVSFLLVDILYGGLLLFHISPCGPKGRNMTGKLAVGNIPNIYLLANGMPDLHDSPAPLIFQLSWIWAYEPYQAVLFALAFIGNMLYHYCQIVCVMMHATNVRMCIIFQSDQ